MKTWFNTSINFGSGNSSWMRNCNWHILLCFNVSFQIFFINLISHTYEILYVVNQLLYVFVMNGGGTISLYVDSIPLFKLHQALTISLLFVQPNIKAFSRKVRGFITHHLNRISWNSNLKV